MVALSVSISSITSPAENESPGCALISAYFQTLLVFSIPSFNFQLAMLPSVIVGDSDGMEKFEAAHVAGVSEKSVAIGQHHVLNLIAVDLVTDFLSRPRSCAGQCEKSILSKPDKPGIYTTWRQGGEPG